MDLAILSTCPESDRCPAERYLGQIKRSARLAERAGHTALVIHSDNTLFDPWVVAQVVLQSTQRLRPAVTVQPLYYHPFATAKKVETFVRLYGRAPILNLVAGASRSDLMSLDDRTAHDQRYARVVEYGQLVKRLLSSRDPVQHEGSYYRVDRPAGLRPLEPSEMPGILVAGTSDAGREAAVQLGARAVHLAVEDLPASEGETGPYVRLGIVTRPEAAEAWEFAHSQFHAQPDRRMRHRLDLRWTDSEWQRRLLAAADPAEGPGAYWMQPFSDGSSPCAYLVGDYRTVGRELRALFEHGVRGIVLGEPADALDMRHTMEVLRRAWARFASPLTLSA